MPMELSRAFIKKAQAGIVAKNMNNRESKVEKDRKQPGFAIQAETACNLRHKERSGFTCNTNGVDIQLETFGRGGYQCKDDYIFQSLVWYFKM